VRWVEHASDTALTAHLYSYLPYEQDVTLRLYRLRKGIYRVKLAYEGKDAAKGLFSRGLKDFDGSQRSRFQFDRGVSWC